MCINRRQFFLFASSLLVYAAITQIFGSIWTTLPSLSRRSSARSSFEDFVLTVVDEIENPYQRKQTRSNNGLQEAQTRRKPRGTLKLPKPIFLLSLPKSGTTSIHKFIVCGTGNPVGVLNHWMKNATGYQARMGTCMYHNEQRNRDILEGCGGEYTALTDIGAVWNEVPNNPRSKSYCYYPSIHGLESIYKYYPNSTIMLVYRNSSSWASSIFTWRNLAGRLGDCPGFPSTPASPGDQTYGDFNRWVDFYERHTESIRKFAQEHPSLTYVEASLEDDGTAALLQEKTGIDGSCWKNCKPEVRGCEGETIITKKPVKKVLYNRTQVFAPSTINGPLFVDPYTKKTISETFKVPSPIFVLSLPASKSFKLYQYFKCGLRKATHNTNKVHFRSITAVNKAGRLETMDIGMRMWMNERAGLSLLNGLTANAEAILTDMGSFGKVNGQKYCFFPSLNGLKSLYKSSPSMTIVLAKRDSREWVTSIHTRQNLLGRLVSECGPEAGFPQSPLSKSERSESDLQEWIDFYENHSESIRQFAQAHPSILFVEFDVDHANGAKQLEEHFGISQTCWK